MILQEMIDAINRRVDDVVDLPDALDWLNEGQNVMAIAIGAKFTPLTTNTTSTFDFDERYHHIPVLYACARYKEQDSSLSEAGNFASQFEDQKREFVENYELPPYLRDDRLSQQFIATDMQSTFMITKNGYYPSSGNLNVYVNGMLIYDFNINDDKSFTLYNPCALDDKVTAVWEEHFTMQEPPFPWFRAW